MGAAQDRLPGSASETVRLTRLDDVEIAGPFRFIKSDAEGRKASSYPAPGGFWKSGTR